MKRGVRAGGLVDVSSGAAPTSTLPQNSDAIVAPKDRLPGVKPQRQGDPFSKDSQNYFLDKLD
jgi:hypothetical protein